MRRRTLPQAATGSRFKAAADLTLRYSAEVFRLFRPIESVCSLRLHFRDGRFLRLAVQRRLGLRNRSVASAVPLHGLRNARFPRGTHGDLPGRIFYLNKWKILDGRICSIEAR